AQVAEAARLTREPGEAMVRAHDLLERVGLTRDRHGAFPHELSGGMRQRAVIAMALANEPTLLVADEPASGLDVITRAQVLKLLLELRDDLGVGILLVSHDLPTVSRIADEIAVMHEGRIVEHGPSRRVSSAPEHDYTRMLFAAFPSLQSRREEQSTAAVGDGGRGRAAAVDAPAVDVLQVEAVTKRYRGRRAGRGGGVVAVDDVSLSVASGEIVAVVGESGAGKSTLARLILGLERPDEGAVRVDGQDLCELSSSELRAARHGMHLVLQDPFQSLHPGMRVEQLVGEPLAVRGVQRRERAGAVRRALEDVSMPPATFLRRFPHQLSGGQRQRVALARAMVAQPRLVIADEPTSMLDASLAAGIIELILAIRDRFGTGFVYITHDLAVARWVSDRMVVMRDGRIVESGPSGEVVSRPRHPYTRLLLAASEGDLDHIPFNEEEACPVGS
ncbi:MAG: ABC transporter ATP-binding protein, partial [Actinobacteria bacterium]|nr:ABC transporter ATP-binding protein [Actinomycetota bacterium]